MIISFASFKGGVGKTTTAVHLAAFLSSKKNKVLLVDGDPNQSALAWNERGELPFEVTSQEELDEQAGENNFLILDTPARPTADELKTICAESDLVIIPSEPDALSLDALFKIIETLESFKRRQLQSFIYFDNAAQPRRCRSKSFTERGFKRPLF